MAFKQSNNPVSRKTSPLFKGGSISLSEKDLKDTKSASQQPSQSLNNPEGQGGYDYESPDFDNVQGQGGIDYEAADYKKKSPSLKKIIMSGANNKMKQK